MSAESYDLSTYDLRTFNAYEFSDGLVPRIAEALEVSIGDEPTSEDLQAVVGKVGTNKVLRANAEIIAIDPDEMVAMVEESGAQKELDRSLWTPSVAARGNADTGIFNTAVANWQDRGLTILEGLDVPVYIVGGNRVMDTATEKPNRRVDAYNTLFDRYPTEAEYAGIVIAPRLEKLGRQVVLSTVETGNGDTLLANLFEEYPELSERRLAIARVANAGILMASQVRAAARTINPSFDSDPESPQLFVVTDTLPVARTDEEERDPQHFQKAATALRQVVLTAKKLHEITLEA